MNHRQLQVIEYLREENRVLREQLGGQRVRLNDHQRRRLAVKAKALGRKALAEVASIVTPETFRAVTLSAMSPSFRQFTSHSLRNNTR